MACGRLIVGLGFALSLMAAGVRPAAAAESEGAFVQSYTTEPGGGKSLVFKAQVKIVRPGTYTVRAGYIKNGDWHVGEFVGTLYFADQTVRGEAGDVVFVTITCQNRPPLNRATHCAVVR